MAKTIVHRNAPTKPSTVFFGESLMRGVRPMVIPQMYAKTSLQMTRHAGTKNQMRPSRMLLMIKWLRPCVRWDGTRKQPASLVKSLPGDDDEQDCHMYPAE